MNLSCGQHPVEKRWIQDKKIITLCKYFWLRMEYGFSTKVGQQINGWEERSRGATEQEAR
jgi:hypothetical protein